MKTKYFIWPTLWVVSAFCVAAEQGDQTQNKNERKAPNAEAQAVLDALNQERTPMHTEDGQLDPAEVEHVQRMIKIYEMKAGFVDVDAARHALGLEPKRDTAIAENQSQQTREIDHLRSEIVDLRQQVEDLQQSSDASQNTGAVIRDAAGAQNAPTYQWPREIKRYP